MRQSRIRLRNPNRLPSGINGEAMFAAQINIERLPEPARELRFHPSRRWRFDFAWPDRMLAFEIEGGTWTGGRHVTGQGFQADCLKYAEAMRLGWKVYRVTTAMVSDGSALRYLMAEIYKGGA